MEWHKITGTYKTTTDIDGGTVELFPSHEITIQSRDPEVGVI